MISGGLDIGGTKILGAIFNENKEIVYRLKKRSKGDGSESANVEKVRISVVEEMLDGVDEDGTIYVNIPVGLAPWDDGEAGEE